jgi:hypothetical protein
MKKDGDAGVACGAPPASVPLPAAAAPLPQ